MQNSHRKQSRRPSPALATARSADLRRPPDLTKHPRFALETGNRPPTGSRAPCAEQPRTGPPDRKSGAEQPRTEPSRPGAKNRQPEKEGRAFPHPPSLPYPRRNLPRHSHLLPLRHRHLSLSAAVISPSPPPSSPPPRRCLFHRRHPAQNRIIHLDNPPRLCYNNTY